MSETVHPMIGKASEAVKQAGIAWLDANDPKRMELSWADVPDEVFVIAVLRTLKEPDEGMVEAGALWPCDAEDYPADSGPHWSQFEAAEGKFIAMISSILPEEKGTET